MAKINRGKVIIEPAKRNIGVKVNEELWLRLRVLALKQGKLSGELLDAAIAQYLERNDKN